MIAQGTRANGTLGQVVQTACEPTRAVYNSGAMEPRIQYAKTADGVSIAFWTLGQQGFAQTAELRGPHGCRRDHRLQLRVREAHSA
jgi:hypothetical protein